MKIKCPRCKSQLEVDAIGDFVACFHCSLEFTVDEPTVDEPTVDEPKVEEKRVDLFDIKYFKQIFGGFLILVVTFFSYLMFVEWGDKFLELFRLALFLAAGIFIVVFLVKTFWKWLS